LPQTLGGKRFGPEETFEGMNRLIRDGWTFGATQLSEEFTYENWKEARPNAKLVAWVGKFGVVKFLPAEGDVSLPAEAKLISLRAPDA